MRLIRKTLFNVNDYSFPGTKFLMIMASRTFIFHSDDESRNMRRAFGEGETITIPHCDGQGSIKWKASADEIDLIRARSPVLDMELQKHSGAEVDIFADPERGITRDAIRYVIQRVSQRDKPTQKGQNQLLNLRRVCCAIWVLKCDKNFFDDMAKSILDAYERSSPGVENRSISETEKATSLAIVALVFNHRDSRKLNRHLEEFIWSSNVIPKCPMRELCLAFRGEYTYNPIDVATL